MKLAAGDLVAFDTAVESRRPFVGRVIEVGSTVTIQFHFPDGPENCEFTPADAEAYFAPVEWHRPKWYSRRRLKRVRADRDEGSADASSTGAGSTCGGCRIDAPARE